MGDKGHANSYLQFKKLNTVLELNPLREKSGDVHEEDSVVEGWVVANAVLFSGASLRPP